MGRSIAIIAVGLLIIFMGLRAFSGYDTEVEHLFGGEMVTVTCRDGRPVDGVGLDMESARTQCAEARESQRRSVRTFFVLGVIAVAWGTIGLRKARS